MCGVCTVAEQGWARATRERVRCVHSAREKHEAQAHYWVWCAFVYACMQQLSALWQQRAAAADLHPSSNCKYRWARATVTRGTDMQLRGSL